MVSRASRCVQASTLEPTFATYLGSHNDALDGSCKPHAPLSLYARLLNAYQGGKTWRQRHEHCRSTRTTYLTPAMSNHVVEARDSERATSSKMEIPDKNYICRARRREWVVHACANIHTHSSASLSTKFGSSLGQPSQRSNAMSAKYLSRDDIAAILRNMETGDYAAMLEKIDPNVDWTVVGTHPCAGKYTSLKDFQHGTLAPNQQDHEGAGHPPRDSRRHRRWRARMGYRRAGCRRGVQDGEFAG